MSTSYDTVSHTTPHTPSRQTTAPRPVTTPTAKMSCPFSGAPAAAGSGSNTSKCPFASFFSSSKPKQHQQPQPVAAETPPPAADTDDAPAPPAAAATCPLGFGSSRGPKLSTLHCPVCKALLFEAHSVSSCKHTFCRSCISQTRDCPSCGRDVDGLEPNTELAGLVDTFLDTHSQSPELVAAQADLGPLPDNSAASFYMAQGLKSLAGGNLHAALHRLGKAKQALLDTAVAAGGRTPHPPLAPPMPSGGGVLAGAGALAGAAGAAGTGFESAQETSTSSTALQDEGADSMLTSTAATAAAGGGSDVVMADAAAATSLDSSVAGAREQSEGNQQRQQQQQALDGVARAVQLATVCGCLGDCYQRLGQEQQAVQLYRESVAAVEPHSEEHAEAAHAMSVSLNKLGDAHYLSQQLPAAKSLYKQALQLRQLCCGPLTAGQAGPQEQLELAASLIKMADICKALAEADEADQHLHRAHGVCCEVQALESSGSPLSPQASRKLQLLLGVLHAQGAGLGPAANGGGGGGVAAAAAAASDD